MRRALPFLLALSLLGCIEDSLKVEVSTLIRADGRCTRRIAYRLERVDRDKGLSLPIPPENDPLRRLHRFPSGPPWSLEDRMEGDAHVVVAEGSFDSPNSIGSDYWRSRTKKSRPARNQISFAMEGGEGGAETEYYEYSETFTDPASPVAAAVHLTRSLLKKDAAFARELQRELQDRRVKRADLRRDFRDNFAGPLFLDVARLARRRVYGLRERRELEALFMKSPYEANLAAAVAARISGNDPDSAKRAVDAALEKLVPFLEKDMDAAGVPLEAVFPDVELKRLHFHVTLVMPAPIVRANTCVQGDTATWDFEGDDLFGRGFEMWARSEERPD